MRVSYIGDYIRGRRMALGYTQEQLCEGICEPVTISRIENGRQLPSRNIISALLQRLGLNGDYYVALLSKNESEKDALQTEIVSCNVHREKEKGLEKLCELEKITEDGDNITRQFILRSRVLLGKPDGEYSFEEKLRMLTEAIHLTVPQFDLEEIDRFLYSLDEVKVINQIALVYSNHGEHEKAVDIFSQLLKYIQNHYQNILQSSGILPMVAFNYSRELALCNDYTKAIEIAELGWDSCVMYGYYQNLPGLISIIAECYFFLGNTNKSTELYFQAYYLYKAINRQQDAKRVKSEIKNHLGIEIDF